MSSIKDKLKASQQGNNSGFPKLEIAHRIDVDKADDGRIIFSTYDSTQKKNVEVGQKIEGIYIGSCLHMSVFDPNMGKNGGSYNSTYYVQNDNLTMLMPTAKGWEVGIKGNKEAVVEWLGKRTTATPKIRQILLVLTEDGLIAINTNLSIAISQLKANGEALTERYIILTPALYNQNSTTIDAKAKGYLGKLANTNPPKYSEITAGGLIKEEDFESWGADKHIAAYAEWKKWMLAGKEAAPEQTEANTETIGGEPSNRMQPNQNLGKRGKVDVTEGMGGALPTEEYVGLPPIPPRYEADDLPFRYNPSLFKIDF